FDKGFHHISIQPTWTLNYKWVKQPLRDLIQPAEASFVLTQEKTSSATNQIQVRGIFKCEEALASFMVLENEEEIYACDPRDEFPSRDDCLYLRIQCDFMEGKRVKGTLSLENGEFASPPFPLRGNSRFSQDSYKGNDSFPIDQRNSPRAGYVDFLVFIPRQQVDKAVLDLDFNLFKTKVPVQTIVRQGLYAETHGRGVSLLVSRFEGPPNIPFHIDKQDVSFNTAVRPESINSIFYFRAITKSGKTYWSKPIRASYPSQPEQVKLNVWSQTKGGAVACEVDKARVPDLRYEFNPDFKALLPCSEGNYWAGKLGFVSYRDPFCRDGSYPKDARASAPKWVVEDNVSCLRFDGVGNYILFPRGTLPRGSFSMEFEIKPLSEKRQVLFFNQGWYPGTLQIVLDKGKISGTYNGMLKENDPEQWYVTKNLEPKISVPIGQWSKVEIIYDLEKFIFKVNGVAGTPVPFARKGFSIAQPSVFGGHGGGNEYFEGYLKSFRIVHRNLSE
ncbi:MAG: LamG-like jellyroll fold domain-containing protein, partial [Kiritimatiellia bacterium]|nr:LamG-like jellyroll fold domain-containing protein [Kiritimatiellia bacterium]